MEVVNAAGTVDYLWSDGIFGQPRQELAAGDYRVIISDANNCHADTTITLTEPDSIKLASQITQPFCPDKPDGQISADCYRRSSRSRIFIYHGQIIQPATIFQIFRQENTV